MFDRVDRKIVESMGLTCILIDEHNKDTKLKDLDYIDKSSIGKNEKVLNSTLYSKEMLESFGINPSVLPILIIDPRYFDDIFIEIAKKYNVKSLILNTVMTSFLKKPLADVKVLKSIDFIRELSFLKQFYLQPQRDMIVAEFWDIDNFFPLENHDELEYLYIPANDVFIDIDFSTIHKLKGFNFQFSKRNKTIFQCTNVEEVDTRYYYNDLTDAQNWKKLKKFGAYFDKLKSFEGIESFKYLEEFKGEFTSSLQSFEGLNSQSIKTFYYYTETRKTPVTLKGVSGLKNVETIKLSGLKKLNSIADLSECKNLKEFWLEESSVPDDIEEITNIKSLEKVFIDYPEKVLKRFPKLKPYMS